MEELWKIRGVFHRFWGDETIFGGSEDSRDHEGNRLTRYVRFDIAEDDVVEPADNVLSRAIEAVSHAVKDTSLAAQVAVFSVDFGSQSTDNDNGGSEMTEDVSLLLEGLFADHEVAKSKLKLTFWRSALCTYISPKTLF
uniref:Uncharacterized protein n=1 Tax=Coccidioides posadasii RMSCC 3488 TaxID=454284 RepID=A0A0J6F7J0_COCPO|nr:hypothetical protein CPAG_02448 [Coccidioides posadasii RMSCC 3488]